MHVSPGHARESPKASTGFASAAPHAMALAREPATSRNQGAQEEAFGIHR